MSYAKLLVATVTGTNRDKANSLYKILVIILTGVNFILLTELSQRGMREKEDEALKPYSLPSSNETQYIRPPLIFGHVHMAKTGGTSLNGILANKFERVCGHKGYSYDAYQDNERAKKITGPVSLDKAGRTRTWRSIMDEIGYENCDYVSHEVEWQFWYRTFRDGQLHGIPVELHVPCRDPVDHLMSQCNLRHKQLACNATSDKELFDSVAKCFIFLKNRFNEELLEHFKVKCFDFSTQFTTYTNYMSSYLQTRRFVSTPFIKRETNEPRNREDECIWEKPEIKQKVQDFLLENVQYYKFCDQCIGSENEITLEGSDMESKV